MISSSLEKKLKDIGLEHKEIIVYSTILELGEAVVSEIAKKSKVERVNTYGVLMRLKDKGLVSESQRSGKKVFIAGNPTQLATLAEQKFLTIKDALPELMSVYNLVSDKPKIQFFEGIDGLLSIYDDIILTCLNLPIEKREILEFATADSAFGLANTRQQELIFRFIRRRVKNKIKISWMSADTPYAREFAKKDKEQLRTSRLVDPAKFPLKTEVDIYGDKMALFGSKEHPLGVIIEHKEMAETQRQIFELAWAGANLE